MNFGTPIPALFPGASGRIVTALTAHHARHAGAPLPLDHLAREASVAATQLETTLFRLGLLGMLAPRARGEAVRPVAGHIVWKALDGLADLRWRVVEEARERMRTDLSPAPAVLALAGPVADGTATHAAEVLELVLVPPPGAPGDWWERADRAAARLSEALGNVVTVRRAATADEVPADALAVLPEAR
ncbi:hypothetical protein I5Q34_28190 [Streptomyces sp. AV19]|uniref:hypothetical protein n=1 Tax=Streptomyces sp. AV19 TaxID=2793068 RepID=UPI0018FEB69B|nr:hypothetical protein [Streptomyces sp. AV19]MBH1938097.1 hypothetical protein [Streptomyces sp. AV19]MDG4533890.1 hypothetical protein [Streptomyces sp. AV19]